MPNSLPPIDLCTGNTPIIRDVSIKLFELDQFITDMKPTDWDYQVAGYQPLIQYLENKHNAPVLITNGATQALHAACWALARKGCHNLGFRIPYWSRVPEIADSIGIGYTPFVGGMMSQENLKIDSYLLTMPNNPDGYMPSLDTLRAAAEIFEEQGMPLIHDAAYYTRSYLPVDHPVEAVGDVQIFSAAKTYGLSSLRVGYMVVYNASFYQLLRDYLEFSTVGVSVPAQKLLLHILQREEKLPLLANDFVKSTRDAIKRAKQIWRGIDPGKIEVPPSFDTTNGVFAWLKTTSNIFGRAKIAVLPGELFGSEGYCRANLAVGNDLLTEAVKRINELT